ncbi:MAG: M56 family metallopeptidase, partial [Lachnospiraceae bacterium]
IGTLVWGLGISMMAIYSIVSLIKLRRKLIGATPIEKNIYIVDHIDSPFVMGFIRPKIYLPSNLTDAERDFIIKHEQTHIKRLDHITRILSFIAFAVHWFNPLVWTSFVLSGKDMETSCDESVMKKMNTDIRADYCEALLKFATGKKLTLATPLAFGEGDTKDRVENVMKYKKPVVWVSAICLVLVGVVAVSLMSNGKEQFDEPPTIYAYYEYGVVPMNLGTYSWTSGNVSLEADSIHPIEMDYSEVLSYNENKGHRNANIIFSLDNEPDGWNSDNIKWDNEINITSMKRYVDGKEEVLEDFDKNFILVSLETDNSYIYEFKIEFEDGNYAYYSVQINNNVPNKLGIKVDESVTASDSAIDTATSYVQGIVNYYNEIGEEHNFKITNAAITNLQKMNTGTANNDHSINLYKLEYRLSVDNIDNVPLAGGMSIDNGLLTEWGSTGQPYFLFYDAYEDDEILIETTNTDIIFVDYGTDVYLEEYGTAYTAYAMETYEKYLDAPLYDLIPMVMINDKMYIDTGKISEETMFETPESSNFDGWITSTVDGSERPTKNNESNFGEGFGYKIIDEESVAIYINEEWYQYKLGDGHQT